MTHRRPVYRWKTFWLGILILTYLGWAWHDSTDARTTAILTAPHRWLAVNQLDGQAGFFHGSRLPSSTPPWNIEFDRDPDSSTIDYIYVVDAIPANTRGIIIAHWLLILVFLALWTALLALRWIRLNRLSEGRDLSPRGPADGGPNHPTNSDP